MARRLTIARRRHLSDEALLVNIRAVFSAHRAAYGWPRIWRHLRAGGVRVGELGGAAVDAATWHSSAWQAVLSRYHRQQARPADCLNMLNRNVSVATPNRVWTGDMTYIQTEEAWLFLAVVLDLFSRRVVGWSLS